MKDLWKGVAIVGIWGGIGICAIAGVSSDTIGYLGIFAGISTFFIAIVN